MLYQLRSSVDSPVFQREIISNKVWWDITSQSDVGVETVAGICRSAMLVSYEKVEKTDFPEISELPPIVPKPIHRIPYASGRGVDVFGHRTRNDKKVVVCEGFFTHVENQLPP